MEDVRTLNNICFIPGEIETGDRITSLNDTVALDVKTVLRTAVENDIPSLSNDDRIIAEIFDSMKDHVARFLLYKSSVELKDRARKRKGYILQYLKDIKASQLPGEIDRLFFAKKDEKWFFVAKKNFENN